MYIIGIAIMINNNSTISRAASAECPRPLAGRQGGRAGAAKHMSNVCKAIEFNNGACLFMFFRGWVAGLLAELQRASAPGSLSLAPLRL